MRTRPRYDTDLRDGIKAAKHRRAHEHAFMGPFGSLKRQIGWRHPQWETLPSGSIACPGSAACRGATVPLSMDTGNSTPQAIVTTTRRFGIQYIRNYATTLFPSSNQRVRNWHPLVRASRPECDAPHGHLFRQTPLFRDSVEPWKAVRRRYATFSSSQRPSSELPSSRLPSSAQPSSRPPFSSERLSSLLACSLSFCCYTPLPLSRRFSSHDDWSCSAEAFPGNGKRP